MSERAQTYEELRSAFRWKLPERINIGVEVSDRQPAAAPAILVTDGREITRIVTFGELTEASNRLANALVAQGIGPGDRVALILSQRPETAIAHIAIYKLGAIAVPLSAIFGPEALELRLRGAEVSAVLGERESLEKVAALGFDGLMIDVDHDLERLLAAASPDFVAAPTTPDTPALLVYTSGTTGPPKGALHGHRLLAGHLPGFELSHDFFPRSIGRTDDLISSGGYRIGPGEIEECLIRHPAVTIAAVIGVPDVVRGESVKAFVVIAAGTSGSPELVVELQELVRRRLASYDVPREIEFVDELPLTVTGKIRRAELRRLEATARSGAPRQ